MRIGFIRALLAAVLVASPFGVQARGTNVDWLMYNGTYTGDRFSPLAQINRNNVSRLRPLCAFQLGELGPMQAGPVIHNGVMFITTETSTYAIDAATAGSSGKIRISR